MADSTTKVFTIGLKGLKAGEIDDENGGMPSEGMAWHGNVYRDTMNIETSDPTFEDYFEEENDLPAATVVTAGETSVNFEILRPSPSDLKFWCGGSVDSATGKKWSAPTSFKQQELALEVESNQGYVLGFPKVKLIGVPVGGGQKSTPMRLRVSGKVLVPSNSLGVDQAPMIFTEPNA